MALIQNALSISQSLIRVRDNVDPVRPFNSYGQMLHQWFLCPAILCLSLTVKVTWSAEEGLPAKPTSHTLREIEGWQVHVDDRLLYQEQAELGERGLKVLGNRLYELKLIVPDDKLRRLQQVVIWLDFTHGSLKSAQYHPSADWLQANGYSMDLARSVHIPDAAIFFAPRNLHEQPFALMHELAHAYHDQVLGFEHPQIKDAWQKLKESKRYAQVQHISGKQRPHYALTNQMEFFAELSESYFGMNDFFPFNRAELEHDQPEIFSLLHDIWGPLP